MRRRMGLVLARNSVILGMFMVPMAPKAAMSVFIAILTTTCWGMCAVIASERLRGLQGDEDAQCTASLVALKQSPMIITRTIILMNIICRVAYGGSGGSEPR